MQGSVGRWRGCQMGEVVEDVVQCGEVEEVGFE